jgi:GPH family glycoside/pentoside/hexuronide:cation symporter
MSEQQQKLSFTEKAGYSVGDAAANFVFYTMVLFQLNFYTDTMGIAAGFAGTLLLIGRLWDAFFDPLMGVIADRTNTRWGKFRPWVLWTAVPWGVVLFLAYTTPDFSMSGKIIWACITNILLMTLYSANNTPYSALTGVMTGDVNERTTLSSYRFVAAMVAQLIVGGFTLPLVARFGQGNSAKGWQLTMGLWAVVCLILFVITFLTTRERILPDPKQETTVRRDFGDLLQNGPWIAMFILTLAHFVFAAMRDGTFLYYFRYYIDKDRLFDFLQGLGLASVSAGSQGGLGYYLLDTFGLIVDPSRSNVAGVGFSLFSMSRQVVLVVGVVASTYLAARFGKKTVATAGFALTALIVTLFILLPADAIGPLFLLEYARCLAFGPTIPLLWAMFADVVDYSEWRTGRRATGVIYATLFFALKAGLSLGGAVAGWLLAFYGYQANVEQTARALLGIRLTVSIYPAILLAIVVICLLFYRIGKQFNIQIADQLAERRKTFAGQ